MNLRRVKIARLIACALVAASIPLAATTQASAEAKTAPPRSAAYPLTCAFYTVEFGDRYYEPLHARTLDWWSQGSSKPVVLGNISSSSLQDCFKVIGGFGNSAVAFQLANSNLCLNVAGNSTAVGAWVILYPCGSFPPNEQFFVGDNGTGEGGFNLQPENSKLCVDLSAGLHPGSILVQKSCIDGDPFQGWWEAS